MKKLIVLCTVLLAFFVSAPASYAATPYASVSGGVSLLSDSDADTLWGTENDVTDYDAGYGFSGAIGLDGGMYRLEGALGYQSNNIKTHWGWTVVDQDLSILSFMANGYLDLDMPGSMIEPYVMAGIGLANVTHDYGFDSDSGTSLAYQFGAGVGFQAVPKLTFDLGYRYFMTGDVAFEDIEPDTEYSVSGHNFVAGVRVDL